MGLKHIELANPASCLNKAAHDEPVFVLRANDPLAAQAVRLWAAMAIGGAHHEPGKVQNALKLAEEMEQWRRGNVAEPAPVTASEFEHANRIGNRTAFSY